jgi:quercetin dioxygenase-like cupin family protein
MKVFSYKDMKGGWFIGDFEPSALRTKEFEVGYAKHKKNDPWDKHYHKIANEITLVIKGKVKIDNTIFSKGDIFLIEPNEVVDPEFLEDVEFMIIKTPSDVNDKYIIKK